MSFNPTDHISNQMIEDDQNGTTIHTLKNHLNNIGYVKQNNPDPGRITDDLYRDNLKQQQNYYHKFIPGQPNLNYQVPIHQKFIEENSSEDSDEQSFERRVDIRNLVSDVNKSLDNYSPSNQDIPEDPMTDDSSDEEDDNNTISENSYLPEWLKESILILIIYIILSQGMVQSFFGKYIKYINPDENGSVPFIGIVIYGIILVVLYLLFKYLLF